MRRIRGALGIGLAWAFAWSAVGTLPRWAFGINADAPFPLILGMLGFIGGVTFSTVLTITERRRTLEQMSMPRFIGWGAVGGLALSAIFSRMASLSLGDVMIVAPTLAAACAACASGSLALARRAERRELSGGDETSRVPRLP